MLWTNKRIVNGFDGGFHVEWDVHITRGDSDGVPVWHITVENTTRDCGVYYWDAQLTSGSDVSTYLKGRLFIEEEATL